MIEYKIVKITDLGTVNRGKSKHRPRNDSILYGGKYPFIQTADIKKANLYLSDYSQTYNEIGLKQSKLWKKGTLCFTIAANIADSAILDIDACFPDSIVGFLPHENVSDTIYVKYLFDELKLYFQQISKGTTQDNLSLDKICRVKLRVPNYEIQKKIALVLSTYDNLIENNNKRIKLLEKMSENLYKEWFVRFRFPGYENVEFENGIPKEWEYTKLERLANISTGKCNRADAEEDGAYPLFDRSQEIKRSNVWLKDCEAIIVPGEGTSFIPRYYNGKFNLHQRCYCVEPLEKGMGFFLYQTLMMYRIYFLYVATGATVPSLRLNNFNNFKVLLPKKELYFQYNKISEKMNDEILLLKNKNELLTKQRDLLLPRLMSGKLEV